MTITEYFVQIAKLLNCKFEMHGNIIAAEKVFAPEGMLPAFFKRAENLSIFVLNKPLGLSFEKVTTGGGMGGLKVSWDESTPNSYRILCLLDIFVELLKESGAKKIVRLDSLLYD